MNFDFIKSKKKPKFHARPKPRDMAEVTLQYNRQAIQVGHKAREIIELREAIAKLEAEILDHVTLMRAAHFEAKNQPAPVSVTPKAPPESEGSAS